MPTARLVLNMEHLFFGSLSFHHENSQNIYLIKRTTCNEVIDITEQASLKFHVNAVLIVAIQESKENVVRETRIKLFLCH